MRLSATWRRRHGSLTKMAVACAALAVVVACYDQPTAPSGFDAVSPNVVPTPPARSRVCKDGPPGDYEFEVTRSDGSAVVPGDFAGTILVSTPFVLAAGQCVDFFEGGGTIDAVRIAEINLPAGVTLDRITVQLLGGDCAVEAKYCVQTITGTNSVTREMFSGAGYLITFFNKGDEPPPPPPGFEGCTPGFWKNHTNLWAAAGYATNLSFDAVFGTNAFNPDITLLQAINLGGGDRNKLARHGTAALLNAGHSDVSYGMTPAQVIAAVSAAMNSGNYEPLASQLGANNERGCDAD